MCRSPIPQVTTLLPFRWAGLGFGVSHLYYAKGEQGMARGVLAEYRAKGNAWIFKLRTGELASPLRHT